MAQVVAQKGRLAHKLHDFQTDLHVWATMHGGRSLSTMTPEDVKILFVLCGIKDGAHIVDKHHLDGNALLTLTVCLPYSHCMSSLLSLYVFRSSPSFQALPADRHSRH